MRLKLTKAELKYDKFDRPFVALEFFRDDHTWRYWIWSWMIEEHGPGIYERALDMENHIGDIYNVMWRQASYNGKRIQIVTEIKNLRTGHPDFKWLLD